MTEPLVNTNRPTYEQWLRSLDQATANRLNEARRTESNGAFQKGEVRDYFVSESWKEASADQGGKGKDAPVLFASIHPAGGIGFACEEEAFEYATQLHEKWLDITPLPHQLEGLELITTVQKRIRWETYDPTPANKSKRSRRDAEIDEEFGKRTLRAGTVITVPEPGEKPSSKAAKADYLRELKKLAQSFIAESKRGELRDAPRPYKDAG